MGSSVIKANLVIITKVKVTLDDKKVTRKVVEAAVSS